MKIAVYTLTRDRLFYTQHCFEALQRKAGCPFDHFIIDNGSEDGTVEWLKQNMNLFKKVLFNAENVGCCAGCNQAVDMILEIDDYDLVVKCDNDCEVITDGILTSMSDLFEHIETAKLGAWLLSPRVEGIVHQPERVNEYLIGGYRIGESHLVGGLFRVGRLKVREHFRWPEQGVSKIWGEDGYFSHWFRKVNRGRTGYVEDLVVNHFEGTIKQAERYPEYHARKVREWDDIVW